MLLESHIFEHPAWPDDESFILKGLGNWALNTTLIIEASICPFHMKGQTASLSLCDFKWRVIIHNIFSSQSLLYKYLVGMGYHLANQAEKQIVKFNLLQSVVKERKRKIDKWMIKEGSLTNYP